MKERKEKVVYTATYIVKRSDTLLEFLLNKCNTSRNNVKNLLSHKQVLVNGSVVSQFNFPLAKDDEIKISKNPIKEEVKYRYNPKTKLPSITIIYEDDDFIAIDKPSGLLAVESDNERKNTAYNLVLEYLQSTSKQARPYVLHRIDKETSGVLVFAKNKFVHSKLKLNWNDYVITREYMAIIEGTLEEKNGRFVDHLESNKNNLMYVTNDPNGQVAITNYEVLKSANDYSLVKVDILTGRKNQIRVSFSHRGHPIVGDEKYQATKDPLKRLGLHASILEFRHPFNDKIIGIKAKTPTIMTNLFLNPSNKKNK